jgi:hypothetical protein
VGFLSHLFGSPRPTPTTKIVNVLCEVLLEVPARDLVGSTCLRGKDLSHAVLRGQWLDGTDLRDTNFLGADLRGRLRMATISHPNEARCRKKAETKIRA